MAEYIEREALRAKAVYMHGFGENKYVPLKAIENAPAADAEPVKHGRWLNAVEEDPELYGWVPLDTVLCSSCRKLDKENNRKTPRCPNCGAKMDLEVDDGKLY